jgi:uncharacterized surface protein with fasciclin (FAS1) repeats
MATTTPHHRTRRGLGLAAALLAGGLLFAACGDDDGDSASPTPASSESPQATTEAPSPTTEAASPTTVAEDDMTSAPATMGASGPGCAAVPADGEGSFAGMADDPAATAASNNPVLTTLVQAVGAADLGDTLNSEGPFTIFAPTNDAFAAIPPDQLDAVLADTELLTDVLTFHVVAGQMLSAADLEAAGSVETVNGAQLTFSDEGGALTINGTATGVCTDVPTANATVHIIDQVLLPS